jgi:hypothetical protein
MHHDHGAHGLDLGWLMGLLPSGAAFLALPLALWLTGMLVGATHCTGMCGPFIVVRASRVGAALPAEAVNIWSRLLVGALPAYHAGRTLTYSLFGALAGMVGEGAAAVAGLGPVRVVAIGVAVTILMAPVVRRLAPIAPPRWWQEAISRWAASATALPGRWGDIALGIAMGFLPCGMIYVAVAAAAGAGSAAGGALAMAAFAFGTWIPLAVVGAIGTATGRRLRHYLSRWAAPVAALNLLALGVWFAHVG